MDKGHILLMEDDKAMRLYLKQALIKADYAVTDVDCASVAAQLLQRRSFALLLADIVAPKMDGIKLVKHFAEVSPGTKIICITGFAAVSLKVEKAAPHARVLSKPFHLSNLVQEVDQLLGNYPRPEH